MDSLQISSTTCDTLDTLDKIVSDIDDLERDVDLVEAHMNDLTEYLSEIKHHLTHGQSTLILEPKKTREQVSLLQSLLTSVLRDSALCEAKGYEMMDKLNAQI